MTVCLLYWCIEAPMCFPTEIVQVMSTCALTPLLQPVLLNVPCMAAGLLAKWSLQHTWYVFQTNLWLRFHHVVVVPRSSRTSRMLMFRCGCTVWNCRHVDNSHNILLFSFLRIFYNWNMTRLVFADCTRISNKISRKQIISSEDSPHQPKFWLASRMVDALAPLCSFNRSFYFCCNYISVILLWLEAKRERHWGLLSTYQTSLVWHSYHDVYCSTFTYRVSSSDRIWALGQDVG